MHEMLAWVFTLKIYRSCEEREPPSPIPHLILHPYLPHPFYQASLSSAFLPNDDPVMIQLYNLSQSQQGGASLLMMVEQVWGSSWDMS